MNSKYAIRFGIAVIASMIFAASPALAQPGGMGPHGNMDPEERLEMRLGFLDERLDLSDDQVESLRAILETAHKEAMAWREENDDITREDRRAFFEEHRSATNGKIEEILNDEQREEFEQLKDARGPRGRGMREGHGRMGMGAADHHFRKHGRRAGPGGALRALDLTPEQKEAFREILTEEQREKLDRMLDAPVRRGFHGRQHGGGPGMLLNQLDLTDEQQTKIDELQKNHRAAAKAWHDANPNATREERQAFRDAHRDGMRTMLDNILTEAQREKLDSLRTEHPMGPGKMHHGHGKMHGQ